jgi:hypothetical protein
MPKCLVYSDTFTDGGGVTRESYFAQLQEISTCANSPDQYVILTSSEYTTLQENGVENILTAFIDPSYITQAQYETLFMLGLTTPLFAYFVAWGYQTVISFMTKN